MKKIFVLTALTCGTCFAYVAQAADTAHMQVVGKINAPVCDVEFTKSKVVVPDVQASEVDNRVVFDLGAGEVKIKCVGGARRILMEFEDVATKNPSRDFVLEDDRTGYVVGSYSVYLTNSLAGLKPTELRLSDVSGNIVDAVYAGRRYEYVDLASSYSSRISIRAEVNSKYIEDFQGKSVIYAGNTTLRLLYL